MLVDINRLHPDTTPVRHRIWPEDDTALRDSIAALGMLEPLLVVRLGDDFDEAAGFEVKDGNRRLAAAKSLGLLALEVAEMPRRKEDYTHAAATAANVVRAPLDPVDLWRAVVELQKRGYTLPGAAACLGISERHAQKLDKMGRLHPDVLTLIETHNDMPSEAQMARIAAAPQDVQKRAAGTKGVVYQDWHKDTRVQWHTVAQLCARTRFPRAVAIFDPATAGLVWEQDVFAQPGSDEEWTCPDVPGFLAAQKAALEVEAAASKGRLVVVDEQKKNLGAPQLPKGWRESHGKADKPKKNETVFACISHQTGAVVRTTAIDEAAEKAAQKATAKQAADKPKGKAPAPGAASAPAAAEPGEDEDQDYNNSRHGDDEEDAAPAAAAPRIEPKHPLTKAGQKLLAQAKTTALRARLRDRTAPISNDTLVPLLILALHANNVEVRGYHRGTAGELLPHRGEDLVRRLITPDGHLQFDAAEIAFLAGETLARVLSFTEPDENSWTGGSGPTAEWIGAALDAQAHLPRLDTAELLATADSTELRAASLIAGQKFTTAGAAKRDLPGKLENWRPTFAHFGAPGPKPAGSDAP